MYFWPHGMNTGWTLAKWQDHLAGFYAERNAKRRPLETFARLVEMCSGIARSVRHQDDDLMDKYAPRALAWLLGVATQMKVNLEQAVWASYPGVCPHCRVPENCTCSLSRVLNHRIASEEERKSFQEKYDIPRNLREWRMMFFRLYGRINTERGELKCLACFLEQLGEVSVMIRQSMVSDSGLPKEQVEMHLRYELADMFAWYCCVITTASHVDYRLRELYADAITGVPVRNQA